MITDLLLTIKNYLGAQDNKIILEAKKKFSQVLIEIIDYRIQLALEERRKIQSKERIVAANSINMAVKSTASTIRSIAALNSAPPPPQNTNDPKLMKEWQKAYSEWYNTKRVSGINIG